MASPLLSPLRIGVLALLGLGLATPAAADPAVTLFKVITVKDDIVIGLTADELIQLGGRDAGAVAREIAAKGQMTAWQYHVRKAANGDLQQVPLRRVGLLANASLRIEPYATPLAILAP
jgi:hypothetical protein